MAKAPLESLKPIRIQSISDRVVDQIAVLIRNGTFAPGDQLPAEHDLATALNVGRSTIREAKQTLIALGMVTTRGRSGAFVAGQDPREHLDKVLNALRDPTHRDVHEVREYIEIPAMRLACVRASEAQIEEMYSVMETIEQRSMEQRTSHWGRHSEIHRMIVRASGNQLLTSLHDLIIQVLMRTQLPFLPLIADWDREVVSHRRLIDAVATRDPDIAVAEMTAHLNHSDQYRHDLLKVSAGRQAATIAD